MTPERGSQRLLMQRCPFVVQEQAIAHLSKLVESHEASFRKWLCYGQPDPDAVFGSVHIGSLDRAGSLITELLQIEELPLKVEIFPLGIPKPDLFQIDFHTQEFGGS